jgi:hypothetical protein
MNFEDDLREALRHEPAPANFAEKVLARTSGRRPGRRAAVLALAAALTMAAMIPPVLHQYRQRQRALEARDRLMAALSITKVQLQQMKEKIRRTTRNRL